MFEFSRSSERADGWWHGEDDNLSRAPLPCLQKDGVLRLRFASPQNIDLLETLVSRCPESVFGIIWTTYFERSLRKLAMHPVVNFVIAKALERANAKRLSYALNELRDSLGKHRHLFASHILSGRY